MSGVFPALEWKVGVDRMNASSSAAHFTPRGGTGIPVRRVQCLTEDPLSAADDCIEALMDEGWADNQNVGDSGLLEEAGGRELKLALAKAQAWEPPPA